MFLLAPHALLLLSLEPMASVSLPALSRGLFEGYDTGAFFDEMFLPSGEPRPHYAKLFQMLAAMPASRSCCKASHSPFTATAQVPSGCFRSI